MDISTPIHLGVALPNYGPVTGPETIAAAVAQAERSGFDSAWVTDHIAVEEPHASTYGTITESLVTLGYCAGLTSRIQLGVSALVVPQREPVLTFKQLSSVDVLAGGRLITAVAAGWLEQEFELLGSSLRGRGRRLDGWLQFVDDAAEQMPGPVTTSGEVFAHGAWLSPALPNGRLELWSAGGSNTACLNRAARLGTWHPVGADPTVIAAAAQTFRHNDADVRIINRLSVSLSSTPNESSIDDRGRPEISGPPEWVAERLAEYLDAGCDGFILMLDPTHEGVEGRIAQFAEDVAPRLRR